MITVQEALERLAAAKANPDKEAAHVAADQVLCEFLRAKGYDAIVDAWHEVEKWYS